MQFHPRIDDALLRELAGEAAYRRGLDYAADEAVKLESRTPEEATASVRGTSVYQVALRWRDGALEGRCDCPVGARDEFCKHQVATALVWGTALGDNPLPEKKPARRRAARSAVASGESDEAVVQRWLAEIEARALHALVIELAAADRDSWRALVARARFASAPGDTLRKAVTDLIGRKRFLDYRASIAYARRLKTLHHNLDDLLSRDPATALDLAGYALQRLFPIYAESDDSAGAIGDALIAIGHIYRRAAHKAMPAPDAFAKALFKLVLLDDWSVLGELDDYVEVLGSKGVTLLERQASVRLDALPPPSGRSQWDEHASERLSLQHLLEALARHGGDIEALLTRRAQALHAPWDWLALAQLCEAHDRARLALQWLERGIKAFPEDIRLLEALAQRRLAEGFADEALPLYWTAFQHQPGEDQYLRLLEAASRNDQRDHWRERALAHVRKLQVQPGDILVRLHLAEGDPGAALAVADDARLPLHTWARLARAVEHEHPAAALQICRTLVQGCVERTNRQGYQDALGWIKRMLPLHRKLGSDAEFENYLDTLRTTHRAKKNFIGMLQGIGPH